MKFRSPLVQSTTLFLVFTPFLLAACGPGSEYDVEANYVKQEVEIPMRDGIHLFATIYVPRDTSRFYPFLIRKSPYSSGPYEDGDYRDHIGPNGTSRFAEEGYIFVYEDVRGRWMSEGRFHNMTPHKVEKADPEDVDESSDMYDTVEWLIENIHPNNGRAGIWGISYPGFYAAASVAENHPALKASSPQAPIADWFVGDDFHHNGAFYLQDAFRFFWRFEHPEPNPTRARRESFDFGTDDAYAFFLDMGPLKNANEMYFHGQIAFWDSLMQNGVYDRFWQSRDIVRHMKGVSAAVLTVGGLFDAEDPYGPTAIYNSTEVNNPGIDNFLVLGPWFHGGWVRGTGDHLGNVTFEQQTSVFYQEEVDLPFFNYYLKDKGEPHLPEALVFETGTNEWNEFDAWPPPAIEMATWYFLADGGLGTDKPLATGEVFDAYISDPANPVPYTGEVRIDRTREYIVEDQRFVEGREDVLVYQTEVLAEDVTVAGPVIADLFVSTTGTDADFVVKLIDVFPDDASEWQLRDEKYLPDDTMAGYQMLVRGEVFRAKFRNSYQFPEPLMPGEVTEVRFKTPHVLHTFKAGHRIMVQVQSSWFPLVDRNPQTFVDIYSADQSDFRSATHRIYRSAEYPSHLEIGRLDR